LSFQRPRRLPRPRKKASGDTRGPSVPTFSRTYPIRVRWTPVSVGFLAQPRRGGSGMVAEPAVAMSTGRTCACRPAERLR
jgi:hypothetical protein